MEKQYNIHIKDYLIDLVSESTGTSKAICDGIIMWAYKDARDATATNLSVEFSGFGTLNVSRVKCEKRIAKLAPMKERLAKKMRNSTNPTWEKKWTGVSAKLDDVRNKLNRIYELEGNKGGVDQPSIPEGRNERVDKQDIQGEAGDMQDMSI